MHYIIISLRTKAFLRQQWNNVACQERKGRQSRGDEEERAEKVGKPQEATIAPKPIAYFWALSSENQEPGIFMKLIQKTWRQGAKVEVEVAVEVAAMTKAPASGGQWWADGVAYDWERDYNGWRADFFMDRHRSSRRDSVRSANNNIYLRVIWHANVTQLWFKLFYKKIIRKFAGKSAISEKLIA